MCWSGCAEQVLIFCDALALSEPACPGVILIADAGELVPQPLQILPGFRLCTGLCSFNTGNSLV